MEKKAIAYTAEIVLENTGLVIEPVFQKERIEKYAKENNIVIVAWFEEAGRHENLLGRPKIKEMVAYKEPYELVLVERTWAFSRRWREIKALMRELEHKGAKLEATTKMWDCISQMARAYYRPGHKMPACAVAAEQAKSINLVETYGPATIKIKRPARLAFESVRVH
jgi:hypothetical protein